MDSPFLDVFLPIIIIAAIAVLYVLFLNYRKSSRTMPGGAKAAASNADIKPRVKAASLGPYMDAKTLRFYEVLRAAVPASFILMPHVSLEKLFATSDRYELRMSGQYADFVIFSASYMPLLVIDLFDMSIVNLETVNKIKNVSKEILSNSGLPVLDYKLTDKYTVDELRRLIANVMNPLRVDKK